MNPSNYEPTNLGVIVGEFGWNKRRAKTLLWVWGFIFIISLPMSLFLIGLPGLILSLIFLCRSFKRFQSHTPVIFVYQHGIVDRRGSTPYIFRYEDIKNLFISVVIINGVLNYILTLEKQGGLKIKIDEHVANVDKLRTLVEEGQVNTQLPQMISAYQQKQEIAFNNLRINANRLSFNQKNLPWSDFRSAEVVRQLKAVNLMIYQKNLQRQWLSLNRNFFPNLALFFAIIDYIMSKNK